MMIDPLSAGARPTTAGSIEPAEKKPDPGTAAPKILFIEGHSTLRDVMAQLLDLESCYEITVAGNGLEGVEKARAWQPDLILMGLRLPLMDGYETIKTLRHNPITVHIPIIVLSAWSSARSKQRALAAGANEHLTPPVELPRLLQRINHYLK